MNNEEIILNNIYKLKKYPELKQAILGLIKEKNELLDYIKIDHLTGAYNRRILDSIRQYTVVVMCDIDNFKKINDSYGHDKGDLVLKNISKIFLSNVRLNDKVCRYGGDEFLIIFNGCSLDVVLDRMEIIRKEAFKCVNFEKITLSAGISVYSENKTLLEAVNEADKALYESKSNGKNQITINKNKKMQLIKH